MRRPTMVSCWQLTPLESRGCRDNRTLPPATTGGGSTRATLPVNTLILRGNSESRTRTSSPSSSGVLLPDTPISPPGRWRTRIRATPPSRSPLTITRTDWADFISSRFDPDSATPGNPIPFVASGGIGVSLNLAAGAAAVASVRGNLVADQETSGVPDVDVLWVGGLTPDAVLEVKVEGASERATGIYNQVSVTLYPHVPGTTKQPAVIPAALADADGYDTYRNLGCGNYYLEVTGVMEEEGHYKLSWRFDP